MLKESPANPVLKHIHQLTSYFPHTHTKEPIPYIHVYASLLGKMYQPVSAKGEGIACVDDVARAAILGFELFECFGDTEAKLYALDLLKFIDYMTSTDGLMLNFIYSETGDKKSDIPSSHAGGAWWSARGKWALAKAYKLTANIEYLQLYRKINITEDYANDVRSLLLLAELELGDTGDIDLIRELASTITGSMQDGYFRHLPNETSTHMWGYHQLEAIAKASQRLADSQLLAACLSTVNSLVTDLVEHEYYYDFPERTQAGQCAYCVSPFVRGLYELTHITGYRVLRDLLKSSFDWFSGENPANVAIYDQVTGICLDGIQDGQASTNAGAESAIEAGYCEVRRLMLQ